MWDSLVASLCSRGRPRRRGWRLEQPKVISVELFSVGAGVLVGSGIAVAAIGVVVGMHDIRSELNTNIKLTNAENE